MLGNFCSSSSAAAAAVVEIPLSSTTIDTIFPLSMLQEKPDNQSKEVKLGAEAVRKNQRISIRISLEVLISTDLITTSIMKSADESMRVSV